jgi:hypothetical protein
VLGFARFEVFKAVIMKNYVFWDVWPVALVRNVSEELPPPSSG